MVMKSAEDRHGCDAAYVLNGAMDRSVFDGLPRADDELCASMRAAGDRQPAEKRTHGLR